MVVDLDEDRFEALIPRWLFCVRNPALRLVLAVAVPLAAAVPLIVLADGPALRLGPLLVLSLLVVAG